MIALDNPTQMGLLEWTETRLFLPLKWHAPYFIHFAWLSFWFSLISVHLSCFYCFSSIRFSSLVHHVTFDVWSIRQYFEINPVRRGKVLRRWCTHLLHLNTKRHPVRSSRTMPGNFVKFCETFFQIALSDWHACALRFTLQTLKIPSIIQGCTHLPITHGCGYSKFHCTILVILDLFSHTHLPK